MLKCVLFWVSKYSYGCLVNEIDRIKERLFPFGVEAVFKRSSFLVEQDERKDTLWVEENIYFRKDILFITDEADIFKLLMGKGLYAVALFHDRNRNENFLNARFGVEDAGQLEYESYEQAYRRLAGIPWDILSTENLDVRESTVDDVEEFYRIYKEPSITYYMENLFSEKEKEKEYMEAYIKQVYGFYGYGLWTVIQRETGRIIGRAGLSMREGYEIPELGFLIEAESQKKGYGFESCSAILRYALKELNFDWVQALVRTGNKASEELLKKLGFEYVKEVEAGEKSHKLFTVELITNR